MSRARVIDALPPAPLLAVLIALLVGSVGCRSMDWSWREKSPRPDINSKSHPKEDAVILRQTHKLNVGTRTSQWQQHTVVKVLTEKGRDAFSRYEFDLYEEQDLVAFAARVIRPNGEVEKVFLEDAREEEATLAEKDTTIRRVKLRLPGVEAGSLIEVVWTREYDYALGKITLTMASDFAPVLRYDAEVRVHRSRRFQVRTYHSRAKLDVSQEGQTQVVRFSEANIARSKDEIYSPDWTMRDPFWKFAQVPSDGIPKWEQAVAGIGRILYFDDRDVVDGFETGLERKANCERRGCLIDQALEYVRTTTDSVDGGSIYSMRPLRKVVEGRSATRFEKAMLLREALGALGVSASFGLVTKVYSRPTDTAFPSADWFNHMVVVVTGSKGKHLVLDPSCEHCGRGKLPDHTRDAKVLLITSESINRLQDFKTEFLDAEGTPTDGHVIVENMRIDLSVNGDATIALRREWKGDAAARETRRIRRLSAASLWRRGKSVARQHVAHSSITKVDYGKPNERYARLNLDVELKAPAYAVVDDDLLIVPLTVLSDAFGRRVRKSKKEDRVGDFFLDTRVTRTDVVEVVPPPGYALLSFPPSGVVDGKAFTSRAMWNKRGGALVLTRELTGRRGRYAKSKFDAVVAPLTAYAEVARDVVIFQKVTPTPKTPSPPPDVDEGQ